MIAQVRRAVELPTPVLVKRFGPNWAETHNRYGQPKLRIAPMVASCPVVEEPVTDTTGWTINDYISAGLANGTVSFGRSVR